MTVLEGPDSYVTDVFMSSDGQHIRAKGKYENAIVYAKRDEQWEEDREAIVFGKSQPDAFGWLGRVEWPYGLGAIGGLRWDGVWKVADAMYCVKRRVEPFLSFCTRCAS